jgi:hypothetical protein
MSFDSQSYDRPDIAIGARSAREAFLVRTYVHLTAAVGAFVLLEVALFQSGAAYGIARAMASLPWLVILGAFMLASWLASRFAWQASSRTVQYAALGGFVVAEALLFVLPLVVAQIKAPGAIGTAAYVTLVAFASLTAVAWLSRKDFSFLGAGLMFGGVLALIAIVAGAIFGFNLGLWFSIAMVAFAGLAVLYDTSKILHHFPTDRHVAAALQLFASIMLLFWYVLRIFMSRR